MHTNLHSPFRRPLSRREMLRKCSLGFGSLAMAGLFSEQAHGAALPSPPLPRPHFPPRVKHVIFAYMSGGVSHVDSWDPKPELAKRHGQPMPVPVRPTMFNNNGNIMASPWEAKPRGQSGVMMTDLFPRLAEMADDLAVIRSMTSTVNEHAQGNYYFHTGFPFMGHPSAGAWVNYGLGIDEQQPARLRRAAERRRDSSARRRRPLQQRLPARAEPGEHPARGRRGGDGQHQAARSRRLTAPAPRVHRGTRLRIFKGHRRRAGRGGDPQLRNRLPHAVRRAGTPRPPRRK